MTWAKSRSLHELKSVDQSVRVTIKDLLLAALTSSLHRYFIETDESEVREFTVRLPVNTHHNDFVLNAMALLYFSLPLYEREPTV